MAPPRIRGGPRAARAKAILALLSKRMKDKDSSSSSESSDDEIYLVLTESQRKKKMKARIECYTELTVNLYTDAEFKSHFRLTRGTFEYLLSVIGENLMRKKDGQPQIEPEKQLLIALWRMGNTECYRSICDRFNIAKSTAHLCVTRVTEALVQNISRFIKWPSPTEANKIKRDFQIMSGFPDIIGAIDGTHIEIEAPKENTADYINRKGYPSIQLQAVCDSKMVFTHIFVGFPGSVHDQRVLKNSPIEEYLKSPTKFPNNTHLVGDAAYTLSQHLLTPFKDNGHLNERQKKYNYCLSSARVTVERSFGLLKGRWRSLLNCLPMKKIEQIPQFIAACCIVHNVCIMEKDEMIIDFPMNQTEIELEPGITENEQIQHGQAKRNVIMNMLATQNV